MRSSTYVEEIDVKRVQPCPACAEAITTFLHQAEAMKPQKRGALG
jgi:predicted Zn-dependent protease